jgi:CBS domain-containing protein
VVEKGSFLFYAASLLRFHSIEAAMMLVDEGRPVEVGGKVAFVSGYPILTKLQSTDPRESYRALFEPCQNTTVAVEQLKSADTLRDLLAAFQKGRFGFAAVKEGTMFATVGLGDALGLYASGALKSDLTAREVASTPAGVERETTVRGALGVMLERRIRRVFIQGTAKFVSDREMISYIFSPRRLQETKESPETMLEDPLTEVDPADAVEIEGDAPLAEAAPLLARSQGGALICDGGLVTPWDLVMKPFASGRLHVG